MKGKTCELPQILLHCKLMSQLFSFMDSGNRQETPRSEMKDTLLLIAVEVSTFVLVSWISFPKGRCEEGVRWHLLVPWVALQRETHSYQPQDFIMGGECPGRSYDLYYTVKQACQHCSRGHTACIPNHSSLEGQAGKTSSYLTCRNIDVWGIVSQQ